MVHPRTVVALISLAAFSSPVPLWAAASSADKTFVMNAARANQEEIAEAQLQKNSSDPNARAFASRMIQDHTQAQQKLQTIAAQENLSSAFTQGKSMAKSPEKLSGSNYLKMEIPDHEKAISLFTKEISSGEDSALRTYAQTTLPKLRTHLELAQNDVKQK